jgi:hypothetical protein
MGYNSDAGSQASLPSRPLGAPRLAAGGRARSAACGGGGAVDQDAFLAMRENCMQAKQRERAAEQKMQQ